MRLAGRPVAWWRWGRGCEDVRDGTKRKLIGRVYARGRNRSCSTPACGHFSVYGEARVCWPVAAQEIVWSGMPCLHSLKLILKQKLMGTVGLLMLLRSNIRASRKTHILPRT